jgi:hypothetical protein
MAQICGGSGGRRGEFRAWKGYLVRAIGLLLAEPMDLLLEPPDLLLHVHGVSDCCSVSIPGFRPCPCARASSWILSLSRQVARYFRCRGELGLRCAVRWLWVLPTVVREPSDLGVYRSQVRLKLTQPVSCLPISRELYLYYSINNLALSSTICPASSHCPCPHRVFPIPVPQRAILALGTSLRALPTMRSGNHIRLACGTWGSAGWATAILWAGAPRSTDHQGVLWFPPSYPLGGARKVPPLHPLPPLSLVLSTFIPIGNLAVTLPLTPRWQFRSSRLCLAARVPPSARPSHIGPCVLWWRKPHVPSSRTVATCSLFLHHRTQGPMWEGLARTQGPIWEGLAQGR